MKKIALVTVTYNALKNLSFFLPSLLKNREKLQGIYFIDNNSQDDTISHLEDFKQQNKDTIPITTLSHKKNYGYAYAINVGIKKALEDGFDYICVTNNDVIFDQEFISTMVHDAETHMLDALGVPASLNTEDIGLGYTLDKTTGFPRKDPPLKRLEQKLDETSPIEIDFPHGGTILFTRNFFETIGLYDDALFFGGDELDFLYRVTAFNETHSTKIKCGVSIKSALLIDNLSKHNTGDKITKAKRMLQGVIHVSLKHRFSPLDKGLYLEQYILIQNLSKGLLLRYIVLYAFCIRGLLIEITAYYTHKKTHTN